ncbi:hypothetical protein B0H21DRAFT_741928 [Amylocystis lapponica]|nr:hypothetical protein B0H21DRAFT_741928 [Amylocystis lapponica]
MQSLKNKALLASHAYPLSFAQSAYNPLLAAIGDAQIVLIGDGSHGTYEFYAHRANLTKRLIEEKGFTAVAVEADWPDAFRINRYIHGDVDVKNPRDALKDFERFPKWMWKNEVMPSFIQYLRDHNDRIVREARDPSKKVSFYGMDLYSLHRSADEVIRYLEEVDPKGAEAARKRYNCFERFGENTTRYAYETQFGLKKDCHNEVIANLKRLLMNRQKYLEEQHAGVDSHYGHLGEDQFVAEMNALVVKDAEEYYRTMLTEDERSWNLRDDHFARTLVKVAEHLGTYNSEKASWAPAKIVVWAHNSHVGDARATEMGRRRDEINVGQRCRELFGTNNVFNIGFLTNRGTVTAAHHWDGTAYLQQMNAPVDRSLERMFDEYAPEDCFVITHNIVGVQGQGRGRQKVEVAPELTSLLNQPRLQRFIGVLYKRTTEIPSHYSTCCAADQYDAVVHIRKSRGIQPLEAEDTWSDPANHKGEVDPTFPFGQ